MEPKLRYSLEGESIHFSVGAFIKNDKGEYLLIDRLKKPFGFACPAGHIDEGEKALTAIKREVEEETGLTPIKIERIKLGGNSAPPQEMCSRGVSIHHWYLYEIQAQGELIFKADEVKSIGWYSVEQIKELPLESVWKHWFKLLKDIE